MSHPFRRITLMCLVLCLLSPLVLRAQWIDLIVDVSVSSFSFQSAPKVRSYASAALYGPYGTRDYSLVILGHEVWEESTWWPLYQGRFAYDTGYANNLVTLGADYELCYFARASGHSNKYGLHVQDATPSVCAPPEPDPIDRTNCPVLLDLEQDGFNLSGADPAVSFDIDGDGIKNRISWTQTEEDDAFLCLDRNHNGIIDDGRELFGYSTPLLSGKPAKIGYRALAELDQPEVGGNGDGKIDTDDSTFSELCAWIDRDRDGISEVDEIYSLDQVGVAALEYKYKPTHITDHFGNLFRYRSQVEMHTPTGDARSWPTYDVIFIEP